LIYYDKCVGERIEAIVSLYKGKNVVLSLDEHYKCAIRNAKTNFKENLKKLGCNCFISFFYN